VQERHQCKKSLLITIKICFSENKILIILIKYYQIDLYFPNLLIKYQNIFYHKKSCVVVTDNLEVFKKVGYPNLISNQTLPKFKEISFYLYPSSGYTQNHLTIIMAAT
jgi:hypothetical protein